MTSVDFFRQKILLVVNVAYMTAEIHHPYLVASNGVLEEVNGYETIAALQKQFSFMPTT